MEDGKLGWIPGASVVHHWQFSTGRAAKRKKSWVHVGRGSPQIFPEMRQLPVSNWQVFNNPTI